MSLKSKIEGVIYASEEPVTLAQLTGALAGEAQAELDAFAALQTELALQPEMPDDDPDATTDAPGVTQAATGNHSSEAEELTPARTQPDDIVPQPADQIATDGTDASQVGEHDASAVAAETGGPDPDSDAEKRIAREREKKVRDYLRSVVDGLIREYAESDRGIEIREVAGGFRMATKPEYHDAVRGFVRSLKPALKLSLQALETLAVVAYKQPVTAAEISEIRGVDSAGVLGGLLTRKLIQTAGCKQVIGRPMLYKTSREFLVRFGLKDIHELPSMEEFERMAGELNEQEDLPIEPADAVIERANARGDAEHIQQETQTAEAEAAESASTRSEAGESASPRSEAGPHIENNVDAAELANGQRITEDSHVEKGPGA